MYITKIVLVFSILFISGTASADRSMAQAARSAAKKLPTKPRNIRIVTPHKNAAIIRVNENTHGCQGCEGVYVARRQDGRTSLQKVVADGNWRTQFTTDFHSDDGAIWGVGFHNDRIIQSGYGGAKKEFTVDGRGGLKQLGPAYRDSDEPAFDGSRGKTVRILLDE